MRLFGCEFVCVVCWLRLSDGVVGVLFVVMCCLLCGNCCLGCLLIIAWMRLFGVPECRFLFVVIIVIVVGCSCAFVFVFVGLV